MLTSSSAQRRPGLAVTSFLLIASIVLGALLGHFLPVSGQWLGERVGHTLLLLVGLLLFGALVQAAPDTDLASLPQVPADASEFSEDVARTNNQSVLGYKHIQNEF